MAFALPGFSNTPRNPYGPPGPDYKRLFLYVCLGFVGLVVVAILSVTVFTDHSKPDFELVIGRLQFLSNTMTHEQKNISNESLAQLNSQGTLLIDSDTAPLLRELLIKYSQNTIDSDIQAETNDTTVATQLSTAKLQDNYDSTYKSILVAKMDSLLATLPGIRDSIPGSAYKADMNKTITDLTYLTHALNKLSVQ